MTKRFHGKIGEEYALFERAYTHFNEFQERIAKQVSKHCKGKKVYPILELGCGPGPTSKKLLMLNKKAILTAVDNEPLMIAQAEDYLQQYEDRVYLVQRDILEYLDNMPGSVFDAVASGWTLHNFDSSYREKVLRGIYRVLKPNGIFVNGDKYAQDDADKHHADFNWSIEQFVKKMAEKGHHQLCYDWIIHMGFDEDPKRLMKERESLSELERIGFISPEVIWRKRMEAIVSARK